MARNVKKSTHGLRAAATDIRAVNKTASRAAKLEKVPRPAQVVHIAVTFTDEQGSTTTVEIVCR